MDVGGSPEKDNFHREYQDKEEWLDSSLVEYQGNYGVQSYPYQILTMFKITTEGVFMDEGSSMPSYYAVVQLEENKHSMSDLEERFVGGFLLDNSTEPDVGEVPVGGIKHPLGV